MNTLLALRSEVASLAQRPLEYGKIEDILIARLAVLNASFGACEESVDAAMTAVQLLCCEICAKSGRTCRNRRSRFKLQYPD